MQDVRRKESNSRHASQNYIYQLLMRKTKLKHITLFLSLRKKERLRQHEQSQVDEACETKI